MTNRSLPINDDVYQYLVSVGTREPELLKELREVTSSDPMARMQIAPEQGQFIAFLLNIINPTRILEIGTFTGYSSLVMALNTPPNAQIITCDQNKEWTNIAQVFWQKAGVSEKLQLKLGPALETIKKLDTSRPFDFIFLDADKENYPAYYLALKPLLQSGGLLMIDNVLWSGRVVDAFNTETTTEGIRELNQIVHQDQEVSMTMLPLADGITLIQKN